MCRTSAAPACQSTTSRRSCRWCPRVLAAAAAPPRAATPPPLAHMPCSSSALARLLCISLI
ncbi:hypothetical protein JYU34_018641 [Plutella xylostella]|uniref:Uncharacterized protein n=1 Tax=Plutella xylostella TaxID=51655 RepID=A0ABQ7PYC0_PLUXY|nr:hypothetical protein JYU34_018641 [Plutella xylostella]